MKPFEYVTKLDCETKFNKIHDVEYQSNPGDENKNKRNKVDADIAGRSVRTAAAHSKSPPSHPQPSGSPHSRKGFR